MNKLKAKKHNQLKVLIQSIKEHETLDPSFFNFVDTYYYLDNMTVRLVEKDKSGNYINLLADSIKFSNDRKCLNITLKDLTFSDGSPITSEDVIKTIKRLILFGSPHSNPKDFIKGAAALHSLDDEIEGLEFVTDKKLNLGLVEPVKEILYFLHLADYGILHKSQYSKEKLIASDWSCVSSGAYRLSINSSTNTTFISNSSYLEYSDQMFKQIEPCRYKGTELVKKIQQQEIDAGRLSFADYTQNLETFNALDMYNFCTNGSEGIAYLTLNIKDPIFEKVKNRQWVYIKILQNFKIQDHQKKIATKATQYFLPGSKGHLENIELLEVIDFQNTDEPPIELQKGFTIQTIGSLSPYLLEGLSEQLTNALGIPVKFDLSIDAADYSKFTNDRLYQATAMASSMSKNVIGEALNLKYTAETAEFQDPTGRIKKLLKTYQTIEDSKEELNTIKDILKQMTSDSEVIPLYYLPIPKFFNKNKLDTKEMDIEESFQLWKIKDRSLDAGARDE